MNFLKKLFGKSASPQDQFAEAVIVVFKKRGVTSVTYDAMRFSLQSPDIAARTNVVEVRLTNIFLSAADHAPTKRAELIDRFVTAALTPQKEYRTLSDAAPDLMPLVRSQALNAISRLQHAEPASPSLEMLERPFLTGLVIMLGLDGPDTISVVSTGMLQDLGTTFEEAWPLAMANLQKKCAPAGFTSEGIEARGVYLSNDAKVYQSSLLLLPAPVGLSLPPIDGDPVVFCLGRDCMVLTGSDNEDGISALINVATGGLGTTAHWCSARLWRWRNDVWSAYEPLAGAPVAIHYANALKREQAFFQGELKAALDRKYTAHGQDIHVSGGDNLLEKDGQLFTTATWIRGVTHGVIPRVDLLCMVDMEIDETVLVAWAEAFALAGHLLTPVPDAYPPAYAYTSFPDRELWLALRAKSMLGN